MASMVKQNKQQVYLCSSEGKGFISGSNLAYLKRSTPVTLDLFHSKLASSSIELEEPFPLPLGCQKCLDLKTGVIYYTQEKQKEDFRDITMSRNGRTPKLDLRLNLTPPRPNPRFESPNRTGASSPVSPQSSCVSSELSGGESPEAKSMVLVGCPRCLMYVMLSEEDPKCPKCKSTVLLDFLKDSNNNNKKTRKN